MGGCIFNTLLASSVHGLVVVGCNNVFRETTAERDAERERERERERGSKEGEGEETMWSRSTLPHLMVWDTIDFILFGCENRISEMERVHFTVKISFTRSDSV